MDKKSQYRLQQIAGIPMDKRVKIDENEKPLNESSSGNINEEGVHITGFPNPKVGSLFLTLDEDIHNEKLMEGEKGTAGEINDPEVGTIYYSISYK